MNEFEQQRLAEQLADIDMRPAPEWRERLLYECGRAAGQKEMRWRYRVATVCALSLLCIVSALSFRLLQNPAPEITSSPRAMIPLDRPTRDESARLNVDERPIPDDRHLTASSGLEDLWRHVERQSEQPVAAASVSPMQSLTVTSRLDLDDLWN